MSYSPLTDQQSGRVSTWGATQKAAYVVLINPNTGQPYIASGGGGGSGFADILYTDDTGTVFVYRDPGDGSALSAFNIPAGTAYTVGANPRPYFPATQAVTGPLTDAELRATPVPVSGAVTANTGLSQPLTDTQLRATAVPVSGTVTANAGTGDYTVVQATAANLNATITTAQLPSAFLTPGLLPVDTLGTPGTPRVQATGAAAASIVLTTTCRRFSMYATTGTWYSISGTATATSHYIAAGERLDLDCPASTTVSVLRETTDGSIRITELT